MLIDSLAIPVRVWFIEGRLASDRQRSDHGSRYSNQNKQLYIVISQTGTLLSRILKQITGAEYNHASISLSRDLERMYSFGRRHPYNPFWGGFVIESPRTGTFKRFSETKVLVLSVSVTEEQHAELKEMLDVMWKRRRKYGYNYIGLATKRPATF